MSSAKGSGSFLKKRTKKLLLMAPWGISVADAGHAAAAKE
jgi:hypothetical protein